jgi:hypothetical protein
VRASLTNKSTNKKIKESRKEEAANNKSLSGKRDISSECRDEDN